MKSQIENLRSEIGFTLIELLVVVTIIVVLLALLVPAMDKAIYQAELASCSANLDGIASGVHIYAAGARRRYPYRAMFEHKTYEWARLIATGTNPEDAYDDRRLMTEAFSLDALVCPLNENSAVDFEQSDPDSQTSVSYNMYFGARIDSPGASSMLKLGQKIGYLPGQRLSVLASDMDAVSLRKVSYGTHPTLAGTSTQEGGTNKGLLVEGQNDVGKATLSYWYHSKSMREPMDLNYAMDDGSVLRYRDVEWDAGQPGKDDAEMTSLPHFAAKDTTATDWDTVPWR